MKNKCRKCNGIGSNFYNGSAMMCVQCSGIGKETNPSTSTSTPEMTPNTFEMEGEEFGAMIEEHLEKVFDKLRITDYKDRLLAKEFFIMGLVFNPEDEE